MPIIVLVTLKVNKLFYAKVSIDLKTIEEKLASLHIGIEKGVIPKINL